MAIDGGQDRQVENVDLVETPPPTIDWGQLNSRTVDSGDNTLDGPNHNQDELLETGTPLSPERLKTPMADLHPDRLTAPNETLDQRLQQQWQHDQRPESWIGGINPGFFEDAVANRPGRTENCAECARSVQSTLEGSPRVAAEIDTRGLPLADTESYGGEHLSYTEQWAGQRAEVATYPDIARTLADTRGSAIVHAYGPEGGHAFNACWDEASGKVRWLDGQVGLVGDWPPEDLAHRFPETRVLYFDSRRST